MKKITLTTKTPAQIDADFEAVFKDIKPERDPKKLTLADALEPYRKAVMKQRRRGLKWEQIAAGMALPRISEKVSAKTLRRVFGAAPKPTPTATSTTPRPRLILDPATGLPVPPSPPSK